MKWAVFEFEDFSCEVGETAWITGEDETLFNNDDWFTSKEIIVKWPKDCAKLRKTLSKVSVDIDGVEMERYSAKVVKFSDSFTTINEHLKIYVETGTTKTPTRGRGHRVPRKNPFFEDDNDEDKENDTVKPPEKKNKKRKTSDVDKNGMLNVIKKKYSNLLTELPETSPNKNELKNEIETLKKSNATLKNHVEQLHLVIDDLKGLPSIIINLKETVDELISIQRPILSSTCISLGAERPSSPLSGRLSPAMTLKSSPGMSPKPSSATMSPRPSTPIIPSSPGFAGVKELAPEHESRVEICPGIRVLPSQKKVLDSLGDVKSYIYSIMEMIWSRDVLATHSLTGKMSNAHKDKVAKPSLDQTKIIALCGLAMKKFRLGNDKDIRNCIKAKLNNVEKCHKKNNN